MQILVRNVGRDLQVRVEVEALPWKRCLENVRLGKIDAAIGIGDVPSLRKIAEFPRVPSITSADPNRSLGTARILLVRRKGSLIKWDGRSLAHLQKPVGTAMGTEVMRTAVIRVGGAVDDSARTDDQNLRKLLQNRVDLMAGYEFDLKELIQKSYRGQVSILNTPLSESHYYLGFSKLFYAKHQGFVEAFWNRIGDYQDGTYAKPLNREEFTSTAPLRHD